MQKLPEKLHVMETTRQIFCEEELIEKVQHGDKEAFSEIYETYFYDLCNFSYRFVKCRFVCQELVQDIFLYIWKNRAGWNPGGSVRSYLFKAIKNRSYDYLKHQSVEKEFAHTYRTQKEKENHHPEPLRLYKGTKRLECAIEDAIESLPEQRKIIFMMSREDGLTYREIADVLNISVKTVETQMGRSLKTLRKLLSAYLPGLIVAYASLHNMI
jgi:RNA polymerase sigma-70 factor, ECF subfamily